MTEYLFLVALVGAMMARLCDINERQEYKERWYWHKERVDGRCRGAQSILCVVRACGDLAHPTATEAPLWRNLGVGNQGSILGAYIYRDNSVLAEVR